LDETDEDARLLFDDDATAFFAGFFAALFFELVREVPAFFAIQNSPSFGVKLSGTF